MKQGCEPCLFGLCIDGLQRCLVSISLPSVPELLSGMGIPLLHDAEDAILMALLGHRYWPYSSTAHGLQLAIQSVARFLCLVGTLISIPKTS